MSLCLSDLTMGCGLPHLPFDYPRIMLTICIHGYMWWFILFDSTKGFPGEGPDQLWSIWSANTDSLLSHDNWFSWDADAICFQETRVTQNNAHVLDSTASQHAKSFAFGKFLTPKKTSKGSYMTPHGGTAIAFRAKLGRPFCPNEDTSGVWTKLWESTRISAAWIQVLPRTRVLCISFYGFSSSAHENHHAANNDLLADVLLFCSQFGDIPVP